MAWSTILDQAHVKETLRRAVSRDRVAHAYLFYGPEGVGKRAVALAFARTLLCDRGDDEACGECRACNKVKRLIHPDLHVLMPQPSDASTHDVTARLQRLAEHPYAAVDFVRRPSLADAAKSSNKQAFYSVKRIQEDLRRPMSYKPLEGRYKVVLITDADFMRAEAANAFLKLLEEPGPQTIFILTTGRPDRLLPTILSRCQRLRFDALPAEAIEEALISHDRISPEAAGTLARMADGSYTRTLDLAENEDLMADRAVVVEFMRYAYVQDIDKLSALVEQTGKLGRERIKSMLRLMLRWIRDLMLYQSMGTAATLVNIDQAEAIARFCQNLPHADLSAMIRLVEDALELTERNVNLSLALTTLAQALGHAMKRPHDGRLYVPLVDVGTMA